MSIGRRLLIDRTAQIQHLDDSGRAKVEVLADDLCQLLIRKLTGTEGFNLDGCGMGYADGIGKLNLTFIC